MPRGFGGDSLPHIPAARAIKLFPALTGAGDGVPGCRALPGGASQIFALVAMLPMPTWAYCFDLR